MLFLFVLKKLFILLLVINFLFSEFIEEKSSFNPFLVEKAAYILNLNYSVYPSSNVLKNATIKIFIPQNATVLYSNLNFSIASDELNNTILFIYYPDQTSIIPINIQLFLNKSADHVYSLTQEEQTSFNKEFLDLGLIGANRSILTLAQNITNPYKTDIEKLAALAVWTNNYINYNSSMVDKKLSVEQIIEKREGVCWHYAVLFSALARSLGYPTRFVHGYAYSKFDNNWIGHVWIEVYSGQWIGVDPTWLEFGYIDATHIPLYKSPIDLDFYQISVSASVLDKNAQLILKDNNELMHNAFLVIPVNLEISNKKFNQDLFSSNEFFNLKDDFFIFAKISDPKEVLLEKFQLLSCTFESNKSFFILEPQKEIFSLILPNSTKFFIWKINISDEVSNNLKSNYIYTCPMVLNSLSYKDSQPLVITINPDFKTSKINSLTYNKILNPGQVQTISFANPSEDKFYLLGKDFILENSSSSINFLFSPSFFGENEVYIFSSKFTPLKLSFFVQEENKKYFANISVPSNILEDQEFSLFLSPNDELFSFLEDKFFVEVSSPNQKFEKVFRKNDKLEFNLKIGQTGKIPLFYSFKTLSGQLIYSNFTFIEVFSKPNLTVVNYSLIPYKNFFVVRVLVNKSGDFNSAYLLADNQKYDLINSDLVELTLKNSSSINFIWTDKLNNSYYSKIFVQVPSIKSKNLEDKNLSINQNHIIFILLATLILLLFFIKSKRMNKNA